ncbi:hypothetical protein PUN28_019867 [Cardiocondyla obscurior]|uniref:Glomulin n=1 Tax=Cardiocondyla obscurior TaxID=286306 RepID=A0AAW2EBY4_9HYME
MESKEDITHTTQIKTEEFVTQINDLLNECKTEEVIRLLEKNTHQVLFDSAAICLIISKLTRSVLHHEKEVFKCAFNVLMHMAKTEACYMIIELQKYLMQASDHENFSAVLNVLRICLIKVPTKQDKVIDWYLKSLGIYIKCLPLSDELLDNPEDIDRLIYTYEEILTFTESIVKEMINSNSISENKSLSGKFIFTFLIKLFEKPFCFLDKYIPKRIKYTNLIDNIMKQAFYLNGDVLGFLDIVDRKKFPDFKEDEDEDYNNPILSQWIYEIPDLAYGNFYFHVVTKEKYWINVPQVYNFYYIFEICTFFFKELLNHQCSISNGLTFMETVMRRIPLYSLNSQVFELEIYIELLASITKIMIYSNSDKQRKHAVSVLQNYIEIFDMEARYAVIVNLYAIAEHSGLRSHITGIFKSSIIQCLSTTPPNPQFLGRNMEILLKKACNLPHGGFSDIIELTEEIITALNLLRFLFIRDQDNETGIWDMEDMLENDYLIPLRQGIDLCRAHWTVKMADLKQTKNLTEKQDAESVNANIEVELFVGGKLLPIMPVSDKIEICYQALNAIDVIESILVRVNECLD